MSLMVQTKQQGMMSLCSLNKSTIVLICLLIYLDYHAEMCQREDVLQKGPCKRHFLTTTLLSYCLDEGSLLIQKQYRDNVLVLCAEIVRLPTTTSVYANVCSGKASAYSCS